MCDIALLHFFETLEEEDGFKCVMTLTLKMFDDSTLPRHGFLAVVTNRRAFPS